MVIKGSTIEGDEVQKTVAVELGEAGADGRKRLAEAGLTLAALGDRVQIVGVKFGSRAQKAGVEQGWEVARIEVPSGRPSMHWFYLPALAARRARLVVAGAPDAAPNGAPAMAGAQRPHRADPRARALGRAGQRRVRPRVARAACG